MSTGALKWVQRAVVSSTLDEAIISRCKQRDTEAFSLLVDRYQARVYGFVRRMVSTAEDAEDISQEVFVRAFQHIDRFDGRASVATWLFKIAGNLCIDRSRKLGRRPEQVPLPLGDEGHSRAEFADRRWNPEDAAIGREMEAAIEQSIASLSEKLRPVLLLYDLNGLSYEEIAGVLEIPVGTVKSRLFLARVHLQAALTAYLQPEETK